jgi:hypothetical protein
MQAFMPSAVEVDTSDQPTGAVECLGRKTGKLTLEIRHEGSLKRSGSTCFVNSESQLAGEKEGDALLRWIKVLILNRLSCGGFRALPALRD